MQTKTVEQCVRCVSSVFSTSIEGAASDRLSRSTELQHRTAGEANELARLRIGQPQPHSRHPKLKSRD